MSYRENLGQVKGDKGRIYIPTVVTRNNKKYITWVLSEEGATAPADIDITPKVYLPSISNGFLTFTLSENTPTTIGGANNSNYKVKGDKGDPGEVDTAVVTDLPAKANAKEGVLYIHDGGIATVYDLQTNDFYDLDNLLKFEDYYTKSETYSNSQVYTKTEIDTLLGDIEACKNQILYTLDKGSITNGD